jgi:hypothetical protein
MTKLVAYDAMVRAIAKAEKVDEVKDIRDKAQALEAYARQARDNEALNRAVRIRIRAERRAGQLLAQMKGRDERAKQGGDRKSNLTDSSLIVLDDLGISYYQASRWQKLAQIPEKVFEERLLNLRDINTTVLLRDNNLASLHTANEENYTPAKYVESAREVLGAIDLDPASCDEAQKTIKAKRYFTMVDDALQKQWRGRVFLNPPYTARVINRFVTRLCNEYGDGSITAAILLTNNGTDTSWWHEAAECCASFCLTKGRVQFYTVEKVVQPTNGQCFFYFGKHPAKFQKAFSQYGFIATKWS